MSVQNQDVKNVYAGNGSTTVFPYTFALNEDDSEYVGVYIANETGVSEPTDNFTIDTNAGTVTYPKVGDPLEVGYKIVIRREIPNEQELNLENLGPFFAEDIEAELDRIVMMVQQLQESDDRSVKVDMSSDITPDQLLEEIADSVEAAATSASNAATSESNADKWAEGSDADVAPLGGQHSSKGWANESHTYANESEIWDEGSDVEVQALGGQHSAQTYAYQAGASATAAAGEVTKASKWAEGSDADVSPLGGTHSAKGWAANAQASAQSVTENVDKAQKWAEGSDAEVEALGGEHSSKNWAAQAKEWAMSMANLPVATIVPWGGTANTPPVGFLFCDGSAVSRTMYPDLFAAIGTTYGPGDGSTTFNLPDEEFLQGVDFGTGSAVPVIAGNTYSNSSGHAYTGQTYKDKQAFDAYSGLWFGDKAAYPGNMDAISNAVDPPANPVHALYADLSDATLEYSSNIHYIIKAFDGQTPDSALIDITQYAADLANKATRSLDNLTDAGKDRFLGDDNFCIIYPNGGTAANPANVTYNTRYVETNPFPGYIVACQAEIFVNNQWGDAGDYSDNYHGCGCYASQLNDNQIVIQTKYSSLSLTSSYSGSPLGLSDYVYTAPCRVKVRKIGKVANS